ncbi:hypothetical protein [Roseibium sp. M-1]
MAASPNRIGPRRRKLAAVAGPMSLAIGLAALSIGLNPAGAEETGALKNTILGLGNCPPWNPQSVEVCRHSVEKVMTALAPRIDAGPERQHLLVNEGASANALKLKATELAHQLGQHDRLIIYANLPVSLTETASPDEATGYTLQLWASNKPESAVGAIANGTWMSASAFAALIHAIPAGEVILVFDTNNPHAIDLSLFNSHSVDHKDRPEALAVSSGPGQKANYSADRTISLFAKHFALALGETEGTLFDAMTVAVSGTRQAAIPICADLKETRAPSQEEPADCAQVPEIFDPEALLSQTVLIPLAESNVN